MSISIEGSVSIAWLNDQCGFVADHDYYFDPMVHHERFVAMQDYCAERFPDYELNYFEANLVQTEHWRRDQIMVGAIQPNMIQGAAMGSEFFISGDKDPDIETTPLKDLDVDGIKRFQDTDWENAHPIKLFLDQIDRLRQEYGDSRPIIPPFYWDASGRATVHGPVTTAQKFMGERVYIEMIENPEFAHAFIDWITDHTILMCRLFAEKANLEITAVHIGECSGCLMGPDHFEEFSVPYSQKMIDALGQGRMHSCGFSDHLLEGMTQLKNMGCVNTGSKTSVKTIRELFGPDMPIETAPDAQDLTFGSPDDMRRFIDQSLEENEGGPLLIVYHFDLGYPLENCLALHERLIELNLIERGRRHVPPKLAETAACA